VTSSPAPGRPAARNFGEEGGRLSYGEYLRLPELLAQQVPLVDPPAHDELLFIIVHQAYELWFKQLLHELAAVRDAMLGGDTWRARTLLRRAHVIERLLISQIDVLETMTPSDFMEFRAALAPASGLQSVQFRELEFLSGAKDHRFVGRFRGLTQDERNRLARRLAEPSLWDAFCELLRGRGLAAGDDDQVRDCLVAIARDPASQHDLWETAEDLLTHDELAGLWRARHVQMVERQIGTKSGTGGSTGAPYLRTRVPVRYYPVLWDVRDWL
jgi:tryptophan 2,3-dioxygenase